jgi:hypothetical protein
MTNRNLAVALYRSHPGKEEELLKIVYTHIPTLRAENLITSREPMLLQSEDERLLKFSNGYPKLQRKRLITLLQL